MLKNLKRATIIGDRTAGAGHNVSIVSSGHGFQTGISFSRVFDPRTGQEWEQVGVQPDVKVDVNTALDVGQSMALKVIAAKDETQRPVINLLLESVDARVHPHEVPAARLAAYAGSMRGTVVSRSAMDAWRMRRPLARRSNCCWRCPTPCSCPVHKLD